MNDTKMKIPSRKRHTRAKKSANDNGPGYVFHYMPVRPLANSPLHCVVMGVLDPHPHKSPADGRYIGLATIFPLPDGEFVIKSLRRCSIRFKGFKAYWYGLAGIHGTSYSTMEDAKRVVQVVYQMSKMGIPAEEVWRVATRMAVQYWDDKENDDPKIDMIPGSPVPPYQIEGG